MSYFRRETLLDQLYSFFAKVPDYGLKVVTLEPHEKDGGVFVKYKYNAADPESAQQSILESLRKYVHSHGGVPSWIGLPSGEVWLVKGTPWREVR